ncbi:hypothetical protein L107_00195 [Cyanobium sp. Copco_Reservoir_LC18]|nr:hypothetical protein L107_00195 [Cyanobium sp. Copco_Reservoir_LC18]
MSAGQFSSTDKIFAHHYEHTYARHLERFRDQQNLGVLEIGYGSGCGVKFWTTVFPGCHLYCFDRDVELIDNVNNTVIKVDQSDLGSLEAGIDKISRQISIIVDDGSHMPAHQLTSLTFLFEGLLAQGGVYIIEDIETSYWRRGSIYGYSVAYGLHDPWSTIEVLKLAVDYVNRRFLSPEDKSLIEYRLLAVGLDPATVQNFESIEFSRNCVVITKRSVDNLDDHNYPHQEAIRRF